MIRFLYKKYWAFGFGSRVYDLLAPQAYLDSIARSVDCIGSNKGGIWLDAGCGSGLSLPLIKERLQTGDRFFGMDLTMSGLTRTWVKAKALKVSGTPVLADFTAGLPFKENSVDRIVAHFSTYTVNSSEKRLSAMKDFHRVLKPQGM
ncbi:MAG: class I SAM-dependent methyltransferase, partial [Nitrospinota bacterium]|nr:class I SAM-dependent methyltransferase [Nitrospinota bacterium]